MNKIIRHLLLCLACLMASTATATAKSKPIFLNNLFYSVNEADGTATLVKAPPQYDYYNKYKIRPDIGHSRQREL